MISKRQPYISELVIRDQRTIEKYLEKYAEPESRWQTTQLAKLADADWDYVVTIPACGENEYLPGALDSIVRSKAVRQHARVLCIIVLNGNAAREAEFRLANSKMRDWFRDNCTAVVTVLNPEDTCPQSLSTWRGIDLLLVDRSQSDWLIPAGHGVGLVRKIGADIALYLITAGKIKCPWLHNTDADARVPDDYFLRTNDLSVTAQIFSKPPACYIYPYQHIPDVEMSQQEHDRYWSAVAEYELWLRYYVAGLRWAGSVYAYPSVGSLLACNALAYARVRGFPKRMAGEDFYFQNKLAKVGAMITLGGKPVQLLTRPSTRVPFGTGQGTIKVDEINAAGGVFEVYHPQVFDFLKEFLSAVETWLQDTERDITERNSCFHSSLEKFLSTSITNVNSNSTWLQTFLSESQVFKNLEGAEQRSKSFTGALDQFNDWFDGFRTLKLIHRLRDDLYGRLPLFEALQHAEFLRGAEPNADIATLRATFSWPVIEQGGLAWMGEPGRVHR